MTEYSGSKLSNITFSLAIVVLGILAILGGVKSLFIAANNYSWFVESHSWLRNELLFLSSFLIALVLGLILIASGVFSFLLLRQRSWIELMNFLNPKRNAIIIFVILFLLSICALESREYTTKITWMDQQGAPFSYLVLSGQLSHVFLMPSFALIKPLKLSYFFHS